MKNIAVVGEQLKTEISDTFEKAKEVSDKIRDRVDTTYRSIGKGIKHAQTAAQDAVEDARDEIKGRPLTAVAVIGAGAFALGLLTGWLITRNKGNR